MWLWLLLLHDTPGFQEESLQLPAVHANASLTDPDRRKITGLDQHVAASERYLQLLSCFPHREPVVAFRCFHVDLQGSFCVHMDSKGVASVSRSLEPSIFDEF